MPVRAAVACEAGVHEPQAVQKLRAGAEGAADARYARPLVQRQRRRDIQHLFHRGFRSLGHPAAGVGGQRLQIPAGAFGIQHPQRQRGFTRPRHARNAHDPVQRDVHVDVFQVVYLCPAHEHFVYHSVFPSLWPFAPDEFDEARPSVGRGFPVWDNDKSFYWDMKETFSACFGAAGWPGSAFVSICWNFRAAVFSGR